MQRRAVIFLLGLCFVFIYQSPSWSTSLGQTVLQHAQDTFVDAFDKTGLEILAAGTLATALAFSQDQNMHDSWVNHQRMSSGVSSVGDFWGSGYGEIGIAVVQLIFDRENGIVDAEGLASSTLVAQSLKLATERARPDSTTLTSFPSGHTQFSFSSATSLYGSYGLGAGIPAYALGIFTGLSRLADDAHWFSDVVAGATIGVLFGRAGFKHHFTVAPMAINDVGQGFGLVTSWRF